METRTYKNWWLLTLNGMISLLFGLMLLLSTEAFILSIILYFGIILLVIGTILLIISVNYLKKNHKAAMILFQSIFCTAIGLAITLSPQANILRFFFLLFGVWAIAVGIFQIAILVNAAKNLSNKNIVLFNGLLTMAMGVLLCFRFSYFDHVDFLSRILGFLAILFGLVMIYLSVNLRKVTVVRGKEDEPHVL